MSLTDALAALAPTATPPPQAQPQQNSWVQDLITSKLQPQTERLKRSPVGFQFNREPFDPSSYYTQLNQLTGVSRSATAVATQLNQNKQAASLQAQYAANQAAVAGALNGVNPNYTYNNAGTQDFSGSSKKYHLKGVSSNVGHMADTIGSMFGIKTIGGRGPGSVPGSDHPRGLALDFMINNVKNGHARGQSLANYVLKNAKAMKVKYVIWNRYIWYPGGRGHVAGWHKYNGPSPHTDHVHVSFLQ